MRRGFDKNSGQYGSNDRGDNRGDNSRSQGNSGNEQEREAFRRSLYRNPYGDTRRQAIYMAPNSERDTRRQAIYMGGDAPTSGGTYTGGYTTTSEGATGGDRRTSNSSLRRDLENVIHDAFRPADSPYASFHATLDRIHTDSNGARALIDALKATNQPSSAIVGNRLEQSASAEYKGEKAGMLGGRTLYANDHVRVIVDRPGPSGLGTTREEHVMFGSEYNAINRAVADLHGGGDKGDSAANQVSYW